MVFLTFFNLSLNLSIRSQTQTQPHPWTENWTKGLLSMAGPIRIRPGSPHSHQEVSISLLSFLSEGGQNENHSHRQLIKLITWTTVLSNSMKLWAMPCKATQDRWVMVESSDKMWSTGEGNDKPLYIIIIMYIIYYIQIMEVKILDRVLRTGALGWPWGMGWEGRWEGASGWGTHVHPWLIHVNVWQNHYNTVK